MNDTHTTFQHLQHLHTFKSLSSTDRQWIRLKSKWIHIIDRGGGMCIKCHESDPFLLEFHHRDPSQKEDQLSYMIMGYGCHPWSAVIAEADKCDILCRNCHCELHNKAIIASRKQLLLDLKNQQSCEICGDTRKQCLDFHHLHGKEFTIGLSPTKKEQKGGRRYLDTSALDNKSIVKGELAKCQVVCKNCHRKIHKDVRRWEAYKDMIYNRSKLITPDDKKVDFNNIWNTIFEANKETIAHMYLACNPISSIAEVLTKQTNSSASSVGIYLKSYIKDHGWRSVYDYLNTEPPEVIKRIKPIADLITMRDIEHKPITQIASEMGFDKAILRNIFKRLRDINLIRFIPKRTIDYDARDRFVAAWNNTQYKTRKEVRTALELSEQAFRKRKQQIRKRYPEIVLRDVPHETGTEAARVKAAQICAMRNQGYNAIEISKALQLRSGYVRGVLSKCARMGIVRTHSEIQSERKAQREKERIEIQKIVPISFPHQPLKPLEPTQYICDIRELRNQGLSNIQIALKLGKTKGAISTAISKAIEDGFIIRKQPHTKRKEYLPKFTVSTESIIEAWNDRTFITIKEIGDKLGLSPGSIKDRLAKVDKNLLIERKSVIDNGDLMMRNPVNRTIVEMRKLDKTSKEISEVTGLSCRSILHRCSRMAKYGFIQLIDKKHHNSNKRMEGRRMTAKST